MSEKHGAAMVQVNFDNYFGRVNRNICWTIYFYVSEKLSCGSDAQKIKVMVPTEKLVHWWKQLSNSYSLRDLIK